jgi:hypothetical protein
LRSAIDGRHLPLIIFYPVLVVVMFVLSIKLQARNRVPLVIAAYETNVRLGAGSLARSQGLLPSGLVIFMACPFG